MKLSERLKVAASDGRPSSVFTGAQTAPRQSDARVCPHFG